MAVCDYIVLPRQHLRDVNATENSIHDFQQLVAFSDNSL